MSVIRISYRDLIQQSPNAISCARKAFCDRDSYGALEIYDIPDWKILRKQVMDLGKRLALDQTEQGVEAREECRSDVRVGPGWKGTPGRETHSLQSGFYANIKNEGDISSSSSTSISDDNDKGDDPNQVWGANRWPHLNEEQGDGEFRKSVISATSLMHAAALSTLDLAQKAAAEIIKERYAVGSGDEESARKTNSLPPLRQMAEQSNFLPARLVYYDAAFARDDTGTSAIAKSDENEKYWLPWHLDFNLATVFAPAMWIPVETEVDESNAIEKIFDNGTNAHDNPEQSSGLLLRNPKGNIIPAAIGDDCMLIQLGAHAQLASGGILRSGPHAVRKQDAPYSNYFGRLSFGLFVYGPWKARMKPSSELLKIIGDESILKDDFGSLMEKAYTGETVLEGYKKFEEYMNGK